MPVEAHGLAWGVLGTAQIAREEMLPAMRSTGQRIVAVASRSSERARATASEFGADRVYGDYSALLDDESVEAVYLPLPNSLHVPWAAAALEAGKHVLCEKPMASDPADVVHLQEAARRQGLVLGEGLMYRSQARLRDAKAMVMDGRIGAIRHLAVRYTIVSPPDNPRLDRSLGGGALNDLGVYAIDSVCWLLDAEPDVAWAGASASPGKAETAFDAVLECGPETTAAVHCGFDAFRTADIRIVGTLGRIDLPNAFRLRSSDPVAAMVLTDRDGTTERAYPFVDQYEEELRSFGSAVRTGGPFLVSATDSLRTAEAVARVRREFEKHDKSSRQGKGSR